MLESFDKDHPPKITLSFLRTMLHHFGLYVKKIDLCGRYFRGGAGFRHLKFVLKYCPNLHTLRIRQFRLHEHDQLSLSKLSSNLKVLELDECHGIDDKWADVLRNFTKLQTLIISKNHEITGSLFSKCKNVRRLELYTCNKVNVQNLKRFFKANEYCLRALVLMFCDSVGSPVFEMIANNLPRIEYLAIKFTCLFNWNTAHCLTRLPHLKKLWLPCGKRRDLVTFMRLLGNRGLLENLAIPCAILDAEMCGTIQLFKRLQTLALIYPITENVQMMNLIANADLPLLQSFYSSACHSITNTNLVELVTLKRNLSTVSIMYNNRITFTAVRLIIEVLKSNNGRPHLHLNVNTLIIDDEEVFVTYLNAYNKYFISKFCYRKNFLMKIAR